MPQSTDAIRTTLMAILYECGFSLAEVGKIYGISKQRVFQILRGKVQFRLPPTGSSQRDVTIPERERWIKEISLILDDWSINSIAAIFGLKGRVYGVARETHSYCPGRSQSMIDLWNSGMSLKEIASFHHTSVSQVSSRLHYARSKGMRIRKGKRGRPSKGKTK